MKQIDEEIQILSREWELIKRQNKIDGCLVFGAIIICSLFFTAIVNVF